VIERVGAAVHGLGRHLVDDSVGSGRPDLIGRSDGNEHIRKAHPFQVAIEVIRASCRDDPDARYRSHSGFP